MKSLPPTEKQIRFVRMIQDTLQCGEPADFTRKDYSDFISANIDTYRDEVAQLDSEGDWADDSLRYEMDIDGKYN